MEEWLIHGGDIDAAAARFGVPGDQWLDLSTGINPIPYPLPELAPDYWHRLPDAGLYAWLRESAADYYGIDDPAKVVPAPGSQAVIQWLPRLVPAARVAIIGPTYSEHVASWNAAGHIVEEVAGPEAVADDADVIIVGNPNNPDGRTIDQERLLELAEGRLLIVDEAFADVVPQVSMVPQMGKAELVVLRSVGKFFGLAGLRLGFALAPEPLAFRLYQAMGPWAVSGPAAAVGAVALADSAWIRATRVRLTAAAGRLDGGLMRSELNLVGGTPLFRLIEHSRAPQLFEHLAQQGILTRPFSQRPSWLRFGIPSGDAGFERLNEALATWRRQGTAKTARPVAR